MELSKKVVMRSNILICVAVSFFVLTGIAMGLYPGSYPSNHAITHYSFNMNFFSVSAKSSGFLVSQAAA